MEIIKTLPTLKTEAIEIVQQSIEKLNQHLHTSNKNVARISYSYNFDFDQHQKALLEDFKSEFEPNYRISGTSWHDVEHALLIIKPDEHILQISHENFLLELNEKLDKEEYNRGTKYVSILINIFSIRLNFLIYQYLIYKHLYDAFSHVHITGYYGTTELKNSSFGQKCTAVIVTLLMSGVKPLVIDEPEAHLDNKLIAEYLVDLIKEKKADIQIVFASHNANFVVNGDAELVYILEVPENDNCTSITSTTIENTQYREKLLKLEGGEEAFRQRERRLLLN